MDTEEVRGLLRHLVATIAYRGGLALRDAPAGFGAFSAGAGMRTPGELVRHLTGLMYFAQSLLSGGERPEVPTLDWDAQIAGFQVALRALDATLAALPRWATDPRTALQGPLADALTHIGQLIMLRRMAGAPIAGGRYPWADIRAGDVGLG